MSRIEGRLRPGTSDAELIAASFPPGSVTGAPKVQALKLIGELEAVEVPLLVVQGERDPFGTPEEFPPDHDLTVIPGADHGFKVPQRGVVSQEDALGILVEATLEWVVREVAGNRSSA